MKNIHIMHMINVKKVLKTGIYLFLFITCLVHYKQVLCAKSATLSKLVTTKVYDRNTGTLYLGLGQPISDDSTSEESPPIIVGFERYNGYGKPIPNTIVTENDETNLGTPTDAETTNVIEFLALATQRCNKIPILPLVTQKSEDQFESQNYVQAFSSNVSNDGKKAFSNLLKDANLQITSGIVALTANNDYIFAAVKPKDPELLDENDDPITVFFGSYYSGIAVVEIIRNEIKNTISLAQTDAESGVANIQKAKRVDETTPALKIIGEPIITGTGTTSPALYWDEHLQRLYIGISQIYTHTGNNAPAGARSVIVARLETDIHNDPTGALLFEPIAPDILFTNALDNATLIVGAMQSTENPQRLALSVHNLRTMHTSTGKSYLIVNGGNGTSGQTGNKIFALPLVDNNNSDPTTQGTLADYTNCAFTTSAVIYQDLLSSKDSQAIVGMTPIPLLPNQTISDIVVVGDTVYISTDKSQAVNTESGIFYSQAMFDECGRIYRWTPWTKRAFPFYQTTNGKVKFFDIDASNGKVWAVDGVQTYSVIVTEWKRRNDDAIINSLLETLNRDLYQGSFAYLDLDQSTLDLGPSSPTRYALFGGFEKVAFAKISKSYSTAEPFDYNEGITPEIPYAQMVISDFSNPANYLLTRFPPGAGCIRVLEYSRTYTYELEDKEEEEEEEQINEPYQYFFAGTQTGLYVFADRNSGEGFITDQNINNLNVAPFTSSSWQKAPNIPGAIIDLKSSGNALYILTFETSPQQPVKNTVYKINFKQDISSMFSPANIKIIAQTSTNKPNSDLSQANMFFAIETSVITDYITPDTPQEQLLLATNHGIYRSNADNSIYNANDQEEAAWLPVDADDISYYSHIFAPSNPFTSYSPTFKSSTSSTVWPVQVADEYSCMTFQRSNIRQLNGSFPQEEDEVVEDDPFMPTYNPTRFNAKPFDCASVNENFKTLYPISFFWSDGARRFFIMRRPCDNPWKNKLYVIPYDIEAWMVTDPSSQMLTDPELQQINSFYWLGPVGANGSLFAGTDTGVVALQ